CEIGVSRNAVIGKLARLNLTRGRAARVPRGERRATPLVPRPSRGARSLQLLLKAHVEDGDAAIASAVVDVLQIPQGPGCSLLELGDDKCRWPIGDVCAADAIFCGNRPLNGLPYCAGHARLAYRASARRAVG